MAIDLSCYDMFKGVDKADLERFAARIVELETEAGDILFHQGDEGAEAFLVVKGNIRIERMSESGKRILLNIVSKGEIFGEMALLTGNPRMAQAVVHEPGKLLVIHKGLFQEFIALYPAVRGKILQTLTLRLTSAGERLEDVGASSMKARVAGILNHLGARFGVTDEDKMLLDIKLTQSDIADLALSSREHINKALGALQKEGVISMKKGQIVILDPASLENLCES